MQMKASFHLPPFSLSLSLSSKRSQPRWQNDISEDLFQIYPKMWFEASKSIQTGTDLHRSPNLAWSGLLMWAHRYL